MTQETPIRVILIDDHSWVHEIVAVALESEDDIQLVAQGSNGQEAILICDAHPADIVLMDVIMPVMGGIEATKLLLKQYPQLKILVLSSFRDDESVRMMMDSGAVGYVLKDSLHNDLASTIRATHTGKTVLSTEVSRMLMQPHDAKPKLDFGLTHREQEILKLMSDGLNNPNIAQKLVISPSTVKFHINNVLYKMGVQTRAEAIVLAAKNNLV